MRAGKSCGPGNAGAELTSGVDPSMRPVASKLKPYSHVHASSKSSSKRTRAAFQASLNAKQTKHVRANKHGNLRLNKKLRRIERTHTTVKIPSDQHTFSVTDVKEKVLVFDGGTSVSTLLPTRPSSNNFVPCKVHSMHIPDSPPDTGLILHNEHDESAPIFVRPPRKDTMSFTGLGCIKASKLLCSSLSSALDHTKKVNLRGAGRQIFTLNKVANLGSQACRGERGVRQDSYHKSKMPPSDWDRVISHIKSSEKLFNHVMHTDAIRHTMEARKSVGYKLMLPSSELKDEGTTIFSSMNISQDAYLRAHTDPDFTYSVMSAHLLDHQYLQDEIIAYFCFPTLGVAVPIRPGDQLIFNPQVPHCISSRCNPHQTVISTALYLKAAVVGLNDNTLELTPQQQMLASKHYKE